MVRKILVILLMLALTEQEALANLIWPGLAVHFAFSLKAIVIGLIIEAVVIKNLFQFGLFRSLFTSFCANFVSALIGFILVPIVTLVWEFFLAFILNKFIAVSSFHLIGWIMSALIAGSVSTAIELFIIGRYFFTSHFTKIQIFIFYIANLLTAFIALMEGLSMSKRQGLDFF